jgi:hypothetical protein
MPKVLQPKRDYSTWPTKQAAADLIGVSTKTIENYVKEGKIKQAKWKRPTGGPRLAVYSPEDVNRLAHRMSTAVIVDSPGAAPPANGHEQLAPIGPLLNGAALIETILRTIQKTSETSEKLFLTIPEAVELSGLSAAYLRRACQAKTLVSIRDGGWKIQRKALLSHEPVV